MDKRNQMENPFFDPDKPGSIFVGMDRYHQYSPHQPRNALTFIQKGDADSLFRKFLIDNIKEAECCPYIPDTELLRFDLANMRQVPPVDTHTPFEEYISKELLPYFQEHCIPPAKRISLRDAVYTGRRHIEEVSHAGTRILGVSITATGKKDIVPVPAAVHIPLKSGGE